MCSGGGVAWRLDEWGKAGGVWNEGRDGLMVAGGEEVKTNREHSEKGEFTKVPLRVRIKTAWQEVNHVSCSENQTYKPARDFDPQREL